MAENRRFHLTQAQQDQYWDQGYIVVPDVLTADEIEQYKRRARAIALGDYPEEAKRRIIKDVRVAKGLIPPPVDPEKGLWKFTNPDRFDQTFADYMSTPKLLDAVEDLIGEDILAFLLMFIYKPPRVEAVHPWHQDAFYFPFEPHDKVLGTWVPLDDAHKDNGTLSVIPGSHKLGLVGHELPEGTVNALSYEATGFEGSPEEVVLDVKAGDAVLFHSRLLHKTGPNVTDGHRRVLTVHMAGAQCKATRDIPTPEYGFRLVRGQYHPGCLNAPEELSVEFGVRSRA